jgi:hypothetical protein
MCSLSVRVEAQLKEVEEKAGKKKNEVCSLDQTGSGLPSLPL